MSRLTVVVTSPRLPAGLLSWPAWSLLHATNVHAADDLAADPYTAAGVSITRLDTSEPAPAAAILLRLAESDDVTWLASPHGDADLLRELGEQLATGRFEHIELEVLPGNWDPIGARLLDVVAVMDRLRSPGGCPWDAEQTHESLAGYLIEEAYETVDAIETGDSTALREELGDVLLQVAFHSRLAEDEEPRWSIDDVAAGLVEKLVRRHPHVFSDLTVSGADEVNSNWEAIKAAERDGAASPLAQVPMGQPALRLVAAIQRKTARAAVATDVPAPPASIGDIAEASEAAAMIWAVVERCRELGIDPEVAVRALAREVRDIVDAAGQPNPAATRR